MPSYELKFESTSGDIKRTVIQADNIDIAADMAQNFQHPSDQPGWEFRSVTRCKEQGISAAGEKTDVGF